MRNHEEPGAGFQNFLSQPLDHPQKFRGSDFMGRTQGFKAEATSVIYEQQDWWDVFGGSKVRQDWEITADDGTASTLIVKAGSSETVEEIGLRIKSLQKIEEELKTSNGFSEGKTLKIEKNLSAVKRRMLERQKIFLPDNPAYA